MLFTALILACIGLGAALPTVLTASNVYAYVESLLLRVNIAARRSTLEKATSALFLLLALGFVLIAL